jgi:hypothetical protein
MAPDFFNALHLTPLPWTAEARRVQIAQPDWRHWDYRHPVVQPRRMSLAGLALGVKLSELFVYARAGVVRRLFARDPLLRRMARSALPRAVRIFLGECVSIARLVLRLSPAGDSSQDLEAGLASISPRARPSRLALRRRGRLRADRRARG